VKDNTFELSSNYRRCAPCHKVVYPLRSMAIAAALTQRQAYGLYLDEYRCPHSSLNGWHLRDLMKRYEKVKNQLGPEPSELLEKIKRLDLLAPKDADKPRKKKFRRVTLEDALRKLPPAGKKPVGRRRAIQWAQRHHREDGEARDRGTRGTAVNNELRRRVERARLRRELLKEKEDD
jgi:hypothetical protein